MSDTISKQDLLNRINITANRHRNDGEHISASILTLIHDEIKSGMYDSPSNQGEAARLREALEKVHGIANRTKELLPYTSAYGTISDICEQYLSSRTEDTPVYTDTVPDHHFE